MALAIYRKAYNAYISERILFYCENTEELFREVKGKRPTYLINATFEPEVKHQAFTIAGLSDDLVILDAALILAGMGPLERKVVMLIVDIGPEDHLLRPAIMDSDIPEIKFSNS